MAAKALRVRVADGRVVQIRVEILILFDEQEQRAFGGFGHQLPHFIGRDAGRRFEDRAERRFLGGKAGSLAEPERAVSRAGKRPQHINRDLQRHQPGVLIFVNVEDNGSGHGVQNIATREVTVRLPQHLQRKCHVQQAELPGGIPGIDAGRMCRALGQERAGRRILDAAGGMVRNILGRMVKRGGSKREKIRRHDVIGHGRRRIFRHPFRDQMPKRRFPGIRIEPQKT